MIAPAPFAAILGGLPIVQSCWVVPSLEEAVEHWRTTFGVGPWIIAGSEGLTRASYRGAPSSVVYRAALAQAGDMQIELLEQTSAGPSPFREVVPEGATGLHHLACFVPDYDAACATFAEVGAVAAFEIELADIRIAMIDTRATLGFMIELFEDKPTMRHFFGLPAVLAAGWDGVTDPLRPLEAVMAALEQQG